VDAYGGKPGRESLEALEAAHGQLPDTWFVSSRDDGVSGIRLYRAQLPPGRKWREKNAGPGIELLHIGHRYAVVWPSVHPEGRLYTWSDPDGCCGGGRVPVLAELPELPDPFVWALSEPIGPESVSTALAAVPALTLADPFDTVTRRFTRDQAREFCRPSIEKLQAAQNGEINNRLNDAAKTLSHFVPEFMSREQAGAFLMACLDSTVYDGQTWKAENTIRSAFDSAAGDWRAVLVEDSRAVVRSAEDAQRHVQAILDAALDATDLDSLPEPEPLISGLLNVAEYTILVGKFGTYKSFVALAWAYCLATGQAWSGYAVPEAKPVVYVAAEGVSGIRKRLRALERRYGVKVPAGMLTVITRPVRLANGDEVAGLRAVVEQKRAALVVLDTGGGAGAARGLGEPGAELAPRGPGGGGRKGDPAPLPPGPQRLRPLPDRGRVADLMDGRRPG
jgi:hypothetical protein